MNKILDIQMNKVPYTISTNDKTYKQILVKWEDAYIRHKVMAEAEAPLLPTTICRRLGYLVADRDDALIMANEVAYNPEGELVFRDVIAIAKRDVIKVYELKEPKETK